MKKSLVFIAVLAVTGAALAQVKISGNVTAGFKAVAAGSDGAGDGGVAVGSSGFGVDTADVNFAATEDLGGGMKAGASMGLVNVVRGAAAAGAALPATGSFGPGNSSVWLSGDFGKLTLATARSTDYLTGGVAFVGGTYMDGRVLGARTVSDSVAYAYDFKPLLVSLSYTEGDDQAGLGLGTSGVENGRQSSAALGLRYTDGPLVGDFGYAIYDSAQTASDRGDNYDMRFAASYDFGSFRVGGGMRQRVAKAGTRTDSGLSASVPLGAVTVGVNWAQRVYSNFRGINNTPAGNGTVLDSTNAGYGLSANYALSKRTSLIADYTTYTGFNGARGANNNGDITSVYNFLLSHSF